MRGASALAWYATGMVAGVGEVKVPGGREAVRRRAMDATGMLSAALGGPTAGTRVALACGRPLGRSGWLERVPGHGMGGSASPGRHGCRRGHQAGTARR
jgi:hypothetical protein